MRRVLQITNYPPPHTGWGVRAEYVKAALEAEGHECVVLNIGASRITPNPEYETVLGAVDFVRKVWRYARHGFLLAVHANGASPKGFILTLTAQALGLLSGKRCVLTFHAGVEQVYFPRPKYPVLYPVFWLLFTIPRTVICNSEEVKDKIAEYGIDRAKVVPIPAFSVQYLSGPAGVLPNGLATFVERFEHVVLCYLKLQPVFSPEVSVEAVGHVIAQGADVGLVLCGVAGHADPEVKDTVMTRLEGADLRDRVMVVDDLCHESFLEALRHASVYLRTHLSDGVCASVLEALALKVPVVAVDNGTRPPGVLTYDPSSAGDLTAVLADVLRRRQEIVATLPRLALTDTVRTEVEVLTL